MNCVIWASFNYNYFRRIITFIFFGLIRIHLTPFIIFIFSKFNLLFYFFISFFALFFISYFNIIDYSLINGSVSEIRGLNKSDLPILILPSFSIFPLLLNSIIIIFGFIFITKLFLKFLYTLTILFLFIIFIKEKLFKQFIAFILGILPYSFILTNGGTALRVITFLFIIIVTHHYISKEQKIKIIYLEK